MIRMGGPEESNRGVDGFLYDGGLAMIKNQPADDDVWVHARGKGPFAAIVLGVVQSCGCVDPRCSGEGRRQLDLLVGYESMAAFAGQFLAWFDAQPVHVRDQAASIVREIKRKTAEHIAGYADGH